MSSLVVVDPAETPVTLAEMKDYLRVTSAVEDSVITGLIQSATVLFEGVTMRRLVTQTIEQTIDKFKAEIKLDCVPVQSIVSVKYTDPDNVEQTVNPADYVLDNSSHDHGAIYPAFQKTWPETYTGKNAVRIRYIAGYGLATAVPHDIKQWVRAHVVEYFENRGVTNMTILTHPYLKDIQDKYRVY